MTVTDAHALQTEPPVVPDTADPGACIPDTDPGWGHGEGALDPLPAVALGPGRMPQQAVAMGLIPRISGYGYTDNATPVEEQASMTPPQDKEDAHP